MSIVYFLLIGLAAGFIAGRLLQGCGFGIVGNLLVGVIGAVAVTCTLTWRANWLRPVVRTLQGIG